MKLKRIEAFKKALQKGAEIFGLVIDEESYEFDSDSGYCTAWKDQMIKFEISVQKKAWEGGLYINYETTRSLSDLKIDQVDI